MTTLYIIAALVILPLAAYAAYLLLKVRQQTKTQQQAAEDMQQQQEAQMANIVESVTVIAKAMRDDQCPVVEGAIRLKVLFDQLQLPEPLKSDFDVFTTIYDKTVHIPTHQAWKDLKLKQRHAYTKEMMALEEKHQSAVEAAIEKVLAHFDSEKKVTH